MRINEILKENKYKTLFDYLVKKYEFSKGFSFINPFPIRTDEYPRETYSDINTIYGFDTITLFGGSTKEWIKDGFYFLEIEELKNNGHRFTEVNNAISKYVSSIKKLFPYILYQHHIALTEKIDSLDIIEIGNNFQNKLLCRKDDPGSKQVTRNNLEEYVNYYLEKSIRGYGLPIPQYFDKTRETVRKIMGKKSIFNKKITESEISKLKYALKADLYKNRNEVHTKIKRDIETYFHEIGYADNTKKNINDTITEIFSKEDLIKEYLQNAIIGSLEREMDLIKNINLGNKNLAKNAADYFGLMKTSEYFHHNTSGYNYETYNDIRMLAADVSIKLAINHRRLEQIKGLL